MPAETLTRRSLQRTAGLAAAVVPAAGLSPAVARTRPVVRWSAAAAGASGLPVPDPLVNPSLDEVFPGFTSPGHLALFQA